MVGEEELIVTYENDKIQRAKRMAMLSFSLSWLSANQPGKHLLSYNASVFIGFVH